MLNFWFEWKGDSRASHIALISPAHPSLKLHKVNRGTLKSMMWKFDHYQTNSRRVINKSFGVEECWSYISNYYESPTGREPYHGGTGKMLRQGRCESYRKNTIELYLNWLTKGWGTWETWLMLVEFWKCITKLDIKSQNHSEGGNLPRKYVKITTQQQGQSPQYRRFYHWNVSCLHWAAIMQVGDYHL